MSENSIKIAVRVRPFSPREIDLKTKLIIEMNDKSTYVTDPRTPLEKPKQFTFDYSYWSHDDFIVRSNGLFETDQTNSNYISQQKIFDDLGRNIIKNAFDGYNCSALAYGQTGSGKSFTMIGYGANRGIIPLTCNELFRQIESKRCSTIRFQITLSIMEIYNEQIRDLLTKEYPKGGLMVRQHPISGSFYPQGLRSVTINDYSDVERYLNECNKNRTIAATNMNTTSSRAHTIVTIHFDQIKKSDHGERKVTSTIDFVDLAGSDKITNTGHSNDRLKENININRSLLTLGNVITALSESSSNSKNKIRIPYRESTLTKLLQNAIGGNSKTVMIATISPADINFNETLNTLRFADRAKRIKNVVRINENSLEKLIRQLKEENQRLKSLIETGSYNLQSDITSNMTDEEIEIIKKQKREEILSQMQINKQILQDTKLVWDTKLLSNQDDDHDDESIKLQDNKTNPYLTNLNEDPMLSNVLRYYLNSDEITIGSRNCQIQLDGIHILEFHAIIRCRNNDNTYELSCATPAAKIKVNGYNLHGMRCLENRDRILFGTNHLYVYINPIEDDKSLSDTSTNITWDFAQNEMAKVKGYFLGNHLTVEQETIQRKIISLLPSISEINAISEKLNKYRIFDIILMPLSSWKGISANGLKILIRMKNLLNQNIWYWDDTKFSDRCFIIKEHYQKFLDGETDILHINREHDPFWEPIEDVLIGTATSFLQNLLYLLDFHDEIAIVDYRGVEQGRLNISLIPCLSDDQSLTEEQFLDDSNQLVNKPYYFKILFHRIEIINNQYKNDLWIRYKIFNQSKWHERRITYQNGTYDESNYTNIIEIENIDDKWIDFFQNDSIIFQIFAVQTDTIPENNSNQLTTRELIMIENKQDNNHLGSLNYSNTNLTDDSKLRSELKLLYKKYTRLEQKDRSIQSLCQLWENKKNYFIFHKLLSNIAFSPGTKLRPMFSNTYSDNPMDIYLFGIDEQEYIQDMQDEDVDNYKYWNEYYDKLASKQREICIHSHLNNQRSLERSSSMTKKKTN